MKILVTGGTGFIGFHVANELLRRGDEVVVVDNFNEYYDASLKRARAELLKGCGIIKVDISDYKAMEKVFKKHSFDKVCHLAAQAGVRYSLTNPFVYERSNVTGTLNLLELCRKYGVGDFVFASSSSVYGNNKEMPFSEDHKIDTPISLYAATKKSNEEMAYTYHHLYGLKCTGLRFFTVYGPYGRPDMALFLFTKAILEGRPIKVFNNGNMARDFTYIGDIVKGVLAAIDKPFGFEIFNLGRGQPVKLMDFIYEIEKNLRKKAKKNFLPIQPGDVPETWADISKAREMLGYNPKVSVSEGVKKFVGWYRKYYRAKPKKKGLRICVVGLGYVGLPLALSLAKSFDVVGFDVNKRRISRLVKGFDDNNDVPADELKSSKLRYSSKPAVIRKCDFVIVAVPTPIDKANRPDLSYLRSASRIVGKYLRKGTIVVFESTVYPGATEEVCVPVIENESGLKCGVHWKVGYSPERINPGDTEHTIETITKVVAGMDPDSLEKVAFVYSHVTDVFRASSIKVAEAAKVIENIQRDLNIALVNELSLIFKRVGVDTLDVLEAAGTKWNFLPFRPGLVGGHCIGVDPYYLTYKAEELGYIPQVILAGRKTNDNMPLEVVRLLSEGLNRYGKSVFGSKVLILGGSFKEDVKDSRNSKVGDILLELERLGAKVILNDPLFEKEVRFDGFCKKITPLDDVKWVDAVILAVPHKEYDELNLSDIKSWMKKPVIVDVTGVLGKDECVYRL